ncbi:hypothetical protein TA3x_001353 [Tundrisphaera sp. TA3]|uniref:hypothetical protein n=1 Tax=Tundrisphaera sp. TA3 TaxID=3435775 RepID=UPI003EBEBC41
MSAGTTSTFTCPACGRVGSSSRAIPPGTRVRCKCGNAFRPEDQGDLHGFATSPVIDATGPQAIQDPLPFAQAPAEPSYFPPIIQVDQDDDPPFEVRSDSRIGRGPEPRYFRWMEMFGWTSVVIGVVEFALTVGASFFLCMMGLYHARGQGEAFKTLTTSMIVCTPFIAWATAVMVTFLLSGFGLWIAVDMARSLRYQCGSR